MFEQSHADGILMMGDIRGGDAAIDELADRHDHVVGVSDRVGPRRVPGVYVDNERGTILALEHLWELGHRSIVCVADERMADGPFRARVYERFMRERGLADRARVYFTTQPDPEPSYRLGRELFAHFDRPSRPTAIYAASDTIAIGLLQAAFQARVVVPDQLSIVGFDDIDIASFTIPPLTTISQSGVEMGRIAADLLLDMIERGEPSHRVEDVIVAPTLVVRQSTAPVPPDR
jgi:LacI family transcriptional regulator